LRGSELGGRHVAERAVKVLGVVLASPLLEEHAGVLQAPELLAGEALVPQAGVEALAEAVLPGLAGLDVVGRSTEV